MIHVVDDHADTRYVVTRLLKNLGYDAVAVEGGDEAIAYLRDAMPRMVILDCNMPCTDGLAVLTAIRSDARLAALPVVMFSGDTDGEQRRAIEAVGIQGWIVKASMDWDEISRFAKLYAGPGTPRE